MASNEQIRELAYFIWKKEGCPEGKIREHYYRAKKIFEEQEAASSTANAHGAKLRFDQQEIEQSDLVTAVSQVCSRLLKNGKIDMDFLCGKPLARAIVKQYLIDSWQVMDRFGRAARPGQGSPVYQGWETLDSHFPTGRPSRNAGQILDDLSNPPFRYDWNTLALLFTSWWSYNRYELDLTGDWRPMSSQLNPRELLETAGKTSIRRYEEPTSEVSQLLCHEF